jgi:FkbM family methyltransferase
MNPFRSFRYFSRGIGRRNALSLLRARLIRERLACIDSPCGKLFVRPWSTDPLMAMDVLWRQEYAFPFPGTLRTIVDAGANIGAASLYFRHRYPDSTIIAIEPDPENFSVLRSNLGQSSAHLHQAALWPVPAQLSLDFSIPAECAVRTLEPQITAGKEQISPFSLVPTLTPQELIKSYGTIDLFKIDIEGAESLLFSPDHDLSWLSEVGILVIELHDRYQSGCSRNFWNAVEAFPHEACRGENICVSRQPLAA